MSLFHCKGWGETVGPSNTLTNTITKKQNKTNISNKKNLESDATSGLFQESEQANEPIRNVQYERATGSLLTNATVPNQ